MEFLFLILFRVIYSKKFQNIHILHEMKIEYFTCGTRESCAD